MEQNQMGRVLTRTLPLPAFVTAPLSGTYTYSGRVLLAYREAGDDEAFFRLATLDDDGSHFMPVFAGHIPQKASANGIRFMCFADNKRVHLGDFILECAPSLDQCETSRLIPVCYPPMACETGQGIHWSEIIVSPDCEHMAWTALSRTMGSANLIARLVRTEDSYALENLRVISTLRAWVPDEENPGFMKPGILRGGEIKQFVRGGAGISEAGAGPDTRIADSVVQALDSEDILQITHTPGYDETTIFSPDEKLGIVMSTRFSPRTNCAVLSLVPRPLMRASMGGLTLAIYMFSVASVRKHGKGNIGPALIEIDRSLHERGYLGVNLADPGEEWFYCSPMSWHPSSQRAMWNECSRGGGKNRMRIAELPDYSAGEPVKAVPVPEHIPYAVQASVVTPEVPQNHDVVRVKGQKSGTFEMLNEDGWRVSRYENFSDDGADWIDGVERVRHEPGGCVYEAKITVRGSARGDMDLRLRFKQQNPWSPAEADFSLGEDGQPQSRGYAKYNDEELKVESMLHMCSQE